MSRFLKCCICLLAAVSLVACNSVDDTTSPGPSGSEAAVVDAIAKRASEAPAVLQATDLVFRVWPQALSCPANFDIDGVIHGTCSLDTGASAFWDYSVDSYWWMPTDATLASGATTVQAHFGAAVFPEATATQSVGYRCVVANGAMQWAGGSWRWSSSGVVSASELEIRANDGIWQSSASTISTGGPFAVTAQIDRASGAGTIKSAGWVVATVAVNAGCVTVDFVGPEKEDLNSCLW